MKTTLIFISILLLTGLINAQCTYGDIFPVVNSQLKKTAGSMVLSLK